MTKNNNYLLQDLSFVKHLNNLKPTHQPEKYISKWIQGRRIMPQGGPFPGVYDIYKTPYIVEPCDNMGPYSEVQGQAMKKGVQISCTTIVENCIAYYWKERPVNQIYLSGTDDLLKDFEIERLTPLMSSAGLIATSTEYKEKSKKTGDTTKRKDYYGGALVMGSLQSGAMARSKTSQINYYDEIDLVDIQMSSGEGNRLKVFDGRLVAFGERSKTFSLSTPRVYGNSLIDLQYDRGDKRKYMIPCPHCGKYQWLCLGDDKSNYGLKGDYKAGVLEIGYYLCFHCHNAMFEGHKQKMLMDGFWKPSVEHAAVKNYRSYHLPSFYSPFMSWTKMHQEHVEAEKEGDDGMRSFTNLYLGKSFEPTGERPDLRSVIEIRSNSYKSETVPNNILILTGSVDVQRGKDKWKSYTDEEINNLAYELLKKKDYKKLDAQKFPRLEFEVVGHGREFRTASIMLKKFYGRVNDYTSGTWKRFTEYRTENPEGLKFKRADGFEFGLRMLFVDSGYQESQDVVYNYCKPWMSTFAIRGIGTLKEDKLKLNKIDTVKANDVQRFREVSVGVHRIVLIHGNYYKRFIYDSFKNNSKTAPEQPANCHITPSDYQDSYFEQLRAEKQKQNGEFWNQAKKPNEALDLLVYNKCAFDFIIFNEVIRLQAIAKHNSRKLREGLKANLFEAKEKLREVANGDIVLDNIEAELRDRGWD